MLNRSMDPLNEYTLNDVFIIDAITAECLILKTFRILHWVHIQWLCKAENLGIHFGHSIVRGIRFQEMIDRFTLTGHCSLHSASIRF